MRQAVLVIDGASVASLLVADTYRSRLRGMLGRRTLPPALLISPSRSVHGLGMMRSLDVAMLAPDGTVRAVDVLRPGRLCSSGPGTRSVLEAPVGSFARWGLVPGSVVTVAPLPAP